MAEFTEYEKHLMKAIKDDRLRHTLGEIKEATQEIWAESSPRVVQNYSDYGWRHSERMIVHAKIILDSNKGVPLTQIETFSLLACIYLHDIGMQCDLVRWPGIKNIAEDKGAKFDFEVNAQTSSWYSFEEQAMIRRNHNYLTAAWIEYSYSTGQTTLGRAVKTIPSEIVRDIGDICRFHSNYSISDCPLKFSHYSYERMRLIAALLCLSGELDVDNNRVARIDVLKNFNISVDATIYHWLHDITSIIIKDDLILLTVILHPEDAKKIRGFVEDNIIRRFIEVNQPFLDVLNKSDISIAISSSSGIVENTRAQRLPEEIINKMLELFSASGKSEDKLPEYTITEGPSTHIATDRWASDDTLGYRAYAYAIYRFMTHQETYCPLTISIQAPWGGGKTSLMRMIQKHLDPNAIQDIRQSDPVSMGSMSIGQVLDEIKYWGENKKTRALPQAKITSAKGDSPRRVTIWFNAWKYQSTKEVWAGLADAIIHQISSRLSPIEREEFILRLNLKRIDADKIRRQIYERIINYTLKKSLPWALGLCLVLLVSIGMAIMGIINQSNELQGIGGTFALISLLGSGAIINQKYEDSKKTIEEEPAAISLSQYLQMPDYQSELGFIHQVEADLRLVFESIPTKYRPMVVFIDDLDRCLPQKTSEVVEGINLFLAGDFPDCMFVIGMDTEMVAAALNSAHAEVLSHMAAESSVPIGWRFMDKFVQLPFIIPPSESTDLKRYINSLTSIYKPLAFDPNLSHLVDEILPKIHNLENLEAETKRLMESNDIPEGQRDLLKEKLTESVIFQNLDKGIQSFNDKNIEICNLISESASDFSNNPRDLKRFVNAFRFQYFLRWARIAQGIEVVSLDQLQRWIVLTMKWPEVVRWIQHGGRYFDRSEDKNNGIMYQNRLRQLEMIGETAKNLEIWQKNAIEIGLEKEKFSWLKDDALRRFFHREFHMNNEGERLSDGVGKGLW